MKHETWAMCGVVLIRMAFIGELTLFFEHLYSFILIWNYCNEVMIHYNMFICIVFLLKPANQCEKRIMTRPASHVLLRI